jgi:hypothetical protein
MGADAIAIASSATEQEMIDLCGDLMRRAWLYKAVAFACAWAKIPPAEFTCEYTGFRAMKLICSTWVQSFPLLPTAYLAKALGVSQSTVEYAVNKAKLETYMPAGAA